MIVPITRVVKNAEPRWYAIYVMYKSEKQVAMHLKRKGIEVYLPLMRRTRKYVRKIKSYEVPMLNCYLFVRINPTQFSRVLETDHVLKFIRQGKEVVEVHEHEIEILKRVEGSFTQAEMQSTRYMKGDEVEICQGALTGLKGTMLRALGKKTFVIAIESLGLDLHLNVEASMIRKVIKISAITG